MRTTYATSPIEGRAHLRPSRPWDASTDTDSTSVAVGSSPQAVNLRVRCSDRAGRRLWKVMCPPARPPFEEASLFGSVPVKDIHMSFIVP